MFIKTEMLDTIGIEPRDQGLDPAEVLEREINRKYANKVIHDVGLCISIYDIIDSSEGMVLYGDGLIYYKILFNLIVFRPSISEVIEGKIQSQSEKGLKITLGFFDDIHIPPDELPPNSKYENARAQWYWIPEFEEVKLENNNHEFTEAQKLYLTKKNNIRMRIVNEKFDDSGPKSRPKALAPSARVNAEEEMVVPYSITASIIDEGLGDIMWWEADDSDDLMDITPPG